MHWFEQIPTLVTVAVLAGIFALLERHVRSARSRLCKVAWFLVFVHFLAMLFEPASGQANPALLAVDWGSLQASAIVFLASVSSAAEDRAKITRLLLATGIPAVAYSVLEAYGLKTPWPFVLCLLACFAGGLAFLFWIHRRSSAFPVTLALLVTGIAFWTIRAAVRGWFDPGDCALLGLGFALPGVLMCRNHWRASPGFFMVTVGFFFWGAVFPVGMLTDRLLPQVHIPGEVWNLPKMFVAFGMILSVVEDMHRRDHEHNRQMQRFSSITSQLLSGATVDSLCGEIAAAVTEVTNFRAAVIHLDDGGRALRVAGACGFSPSAQKEMAERAQQWTTEDIKNACAQGRMIGQNSFLLSNESAAKDQPRYKPRYKPLISSLEFEPNPCWNTGDQLLIPMRSTGGGCLGCITVADPRRVEKVNASRLGRLELLAADLAVALQLKALQEQLARSERLAALGQLVAGVAHELNNPLAAVMGYGELLGDEIPAGTARTRLDKLVNEGRRMKRIVDNLLHFSRQAPIERRFVDLAPIVHEVLALREYCTRTRNLETIVEIEPGLRPIAIGEDQIKQILLNLLNNAADAVAAPEVKRKRVTLRAYEREGRGVLEVEDTGFGFPNASRAFDPFYTTKPVGKGTGLGLSICYGIVKEHGGDIRIENLPEGARVTAELSLEKAPAPVCASPLEAPNLGRENPQVSAAIC
jgi:two-component system, NtrC family, sensor kinase